METKRDYYEVLGVSKNATQDEIKKGYRRLALKFHPDKQVGKSDADKKQAEAQFKEASEAYEVLQDPTKRKQYDQFGFNGPSMSNGAFGGFNMGDFMRRNGGMFSSFFGGNPFGDDDFGFASQSTNKMPDPSAPENGRNVRLNVTFDFKDILLDQKRDFTVQLSDVCSVCNGKGIKDGTTYVKCVHCNGSGTIQQKIQHGFMIQITTSPCHHCHGVGYTFTPCPHCHGSKRVSSPKHISVNIPAGIENGQTLRVVGKGECGINGGIDGNLLLSINVNDSDIFERHGLNLKIIQPVSPLIATLGGKIDVLSPYGMIKVKVPVNSATGTIIREAGKGIKTSRGIGDLIIELQIEPLANLSKEQLDLLNQINNSITINNLPLSHKQQIKYNDFLTK